MQPNIAQNQPYGSADAPQVQSPHSQNVVEQVRQRQPSKLDFNSYYDEHIKPLVEAVAVPIDENNSRGNALFVVLIAMVVLGGFGVGTFETDKVTGAVAALSTFEQLPGTLSSLLLPLVVIGCLGFFAYSYFFRNTDHKNSQSANNNEKLNSIIVPELFKYLDNGCTVTKNPTLACDDPDYLGTNSGNHKYKCRDEVIGVHKGTAFKLMELEIEKKGTDSKALNNSYETVFKGIYLLFDVPKSFSGRVDIKWNSDKSPNASNNDFSGMQRVQLEDPKLERVFQVYADDQIEARYLLTTTMMQSLEQLRFLFGGSELEGRFYNGKLALRINCPDDLFDVQPGLHAEEYREQVHKIMGDLNNIFTVIDAMDLKQQSFV